MKKKNIGNLVIVCLALLNVALWLAFRPPNILQTDYTLQFVGEITSSTAIILISITLMLATRLRFLEAYFGGMDKMWQTHKNVSMSAFLLLLMHFFIIPDSGNLPRGKPLGMLSWMGIVILILITIAPHVPVISRFLNLAYQKWRIAHKLLGVFFIVGLAHYFLVDTISKQTIPGSYMLIFSVIGIIAYVYRQFFSRRFELYHEYMVEKINLLNGTCVELLLKPKHKPVSFQAGQFVYIYSKDDPKLREPHPFTVSSSPKDDTLRLTIKGSGDWTGYIQKNLKPNSVVALLGGFGMFNYKDGGKDQIWIAGGIGVTPFLSWIRDLNNKPDVNVDFFYNVHCEADALFLDEFQALAEKHTNFRVHVHSALKDGHLSAQQITKLSNGNIANKHFYLCGPVGMTEGFAKKFQTMGVPASQIHYEEFNFR